MCSVVFYKLYACCVRDKIAVFVKHQNCTWEQVKAAVAAFMARYCAYVSKMEIGGVHKPYFVLVDAVFLAVDYENFACRDGFYKNWGKA